MLAALLRLLWRDLHDGALDRVPQPGRRERPGPVQDLRFGGPGLRRIQQRGGGRDDHRLALIEDPRPERRLRAGQVDFQLMGEGEHVIGHPTGLTQGPAQLPPRELIAGLGHLRRAR